ncbi:TolC family protein, partial [Bdellovibrionota bacterium FG-2]
FSGGSTISTYLEQLHAQKAAATKLRKDADHLRAEVENQLNQIRALKLQLDSQQVALAQHEEIVRLSQKSYQLGKMNLSEVLASQNDLFDTKVGLMKTRLDLGAVARQCAWNLGELQP